ncbi:MAG: acetate--CoA ligase family protein [Chloroflexi bacterium]|nr:acetate--CoA ligase family protein [Chloroflexota bacterium]
MRFYEHEAKSLLAKQAIPVPQSVLVSDAQEARRAAESLGSPVVLKAQVLSGGRMKAGGVKYADTADEAEAATREIMGLEIGGLKTVAILVERRVRVAQEYYLAVTYDPVAKLPVAIFSSAGGIDIEEAAERMPEKVARGNFSSLTPFTDYVVKELIASLNVPGADLSRLTAIASRLAQLFLRYDLTLAEINPLAKLGDGSFVALDAHVDLDDEAIGRQQALLKEMGISPEGREGRPSTAFELEAAAIDRSDHRGVAGRVVEFGGSLGLIIGGGGASLTAFDAVRKYGGNPANYCEIGGNPSVGKVAALTKHILSKPGTDKIAIIMNVVNNTRVDLVARGVIKGVVEAGYDPAEKVAIFRIPGAWEEEGFRILRKYGVEYLDRTASIDQAAKRAVEKTAR